MSQPTPFASVPKFVINNSDDLSVKQEYNELFTKFGFICISEDRNLGINGGRYQAAIHFHESSQEYMIFFEDDMLLRGPSDGNCKSGFKTYHSTLFEDIIKIIEQEEIHFLKLCFSEVYGNNHENWALMSLDDQDKAEIQKQDPKGFFLSSNVCVDFTNSYNNLPYAVGSYHYCNWPILFTKEANRLIFIENPVVSKYELAWTRSAYLLMLMGHLRCGCLLASPIKHLRQYIYNPDNRIENEEGLRIAGVKICLDTN